MAKRYPEIEPRLQAFIERQPVFFVATAAPTGHINLSPKGLDTLRVLGPQRVLWLNLTGSGNETAAHLLDDDRMTLMFCSFDAEPKILRVYGHARVLHPRDPRWTELSGMFPAHPGARQLIDLAVDLVQTSCGFGVPLFATAGERGMLKEWTEKKAAGGIEHYWASRNAVSIDGKPTGVIDLGD
ncbi:MAG: pyridoxamine 5'-phosphate oxidase family protein [Thiotrichales bacterium]